MALIGGHWPGAESVRARRGLLKCGAHTFRLAAIEQQGAGTQSQRHTNGLRYALSRAQQRSRRRRVGIDQGERQPQGLDVTRQRRMHGTDLRQGTLGFRQPDIDMRR